jgi:signal transduction histidine kinase
MEWQLSEFGQRYGIQTAFRCHLDDCDIRFIDRSTPTAIFRIYQEILTNVHRHAGATEVDVSVDIVLDHFVLLIADNGIGIQNQPMRKPGAYGILGMHERIRKMNGELSLSGEPGNGTKAAVRIPLDNQMLVRANYQQRVSTGVDG